MFTILLNSTTADANVVNANFYHIAQGSRMPMGGSSLAATNLAYNLGSSSAYWNNLFVNNINANSITTANKSLWTLVSEVTLTATASSIEFTGLNGDNDKKYRIICFIPKISDAGVLGLNFNNDSAANYGSQLLYAGGTFIGAYRSTSQTSFYMSQYHIGDNLSDIRINVKTGMNRMIILNIMVGVTGTSVNQLQFYGGVWNNTTSTVSSLKLFFNTSSAFLFPNTHIEIWGRR